MSHHCQPWKLTFYGLGKEEELMTWWGSVISRVPWQWRRVFSSSRLSQPTPHLPPLYLILFGNKEKERERLSYRWLDLILEEHNYQRIEPFFPAQDSVPPAGAAKMMLCTNNGGCRRTSQWELPTCKTRGAKSTIGSASHVSNGVSKLEVSRPAHYNSSQKKSFVVTWRRHFLLSPSILCIFLSILFFVVFLYHCVPTS